MADAHNWPNFVIGQQVWLDYIPADLAPLVSFDAHWGSLNKAQAGWFLKLYKKKKIWRDSLKPRQAGRFLKKKKKKEKKDKIIVWSPGRKAGRFLPKKKKKKKKRIPEVWLKCYRWDLELFKEMLPLERNDKIRIKI